MTTRNIYWLQYPNYDVNKNKTQIKTFRPLFSLIRHAGWNKVSPDRSVFSCVCVCARVRVCACVFVCVFFQNSLGTFLR
jgi:hypothetical protein